tara:strand:- start:160 stop:588 length:429 start_codon:yes stop_codon:yes gene_type:complete
MPYKDKEKKKENKKLYYEKNKEKIKEYYENNKEYLKEQKKEYKQTDNGIKSNFISNWKTKGVKNDDFNSLYEYYLNCKFCEECKVDLTLCKKCLDHDHETGKFRNVICSRCNIKRGFIDRNHNYLTQSEKYWNYKLKKFILS